MSDLVLQPGCQYLRRDGEVTGPLVAYPGNIYPFKDLKHNQIYLANGRVTPSTPSLADIVTVWIAETEPGLKPDLKITPLAEYPVWG